MEVECPAEKRESVRRLKLTNGRNAEERIAIKRKNAKH